MILSPLCYINASVAAVGTVLFNSAGTNLYTNIQLEYTSKTVVAIVATNDIHGHALPK